MLRKKVLSLANSLLPHCIYLRDFFRMLQLISLLKTELEKKVLELTKGVESLKYDALKFKTQYYEAISANQALSKNLDDMTNKVERCPGQAHVCRRRDI